MTSKATEHLMENNYKTRVYLKDKSGNLSSETARLALT